MGKDTIYELITDRMVAALEEGTVPWRKPWNAGVAPRSVEGHVYRGVNAFLLGMEPYASPFWITFNQAKKREGTVKKGEKSTIVVFWKRLLVWDTDEATGQKTKKMVPMLRFYRVFNLEQTEGVKVPKAVAEFDASKVAHEEITDAAAIVAGYPNPPKILSTQSDQAYYQPLLDHITVPELSQYDRPEEYYSTLFHEMGHSTGHPSRLNRKQTGGFGSHDYGREELVAEMTNAYLCAEAGIQVTFDNSAAYLASWIRTIREDVRAVVVAAGAAQRAADHILGRTFEEKSEADDEADTTEKEVVSV